MINCYFCRQPIINLPTDSFEDNIQHFNCIFCANQFDLSMVVTTTRLNKLSRAHIYTKNGFHIRLNLETNTTYIIGPISVLQKQINMELVSFPITPVNVLEKIKLYLTFS